MEDARYRTKVWLNQYLTAGNLTEDDDSTEATTHICYADPPYPLTKVFLGKNIDLAFLLHNVQVTPLYDVFKRAYAFEETVPIEICCIDKTGITGAKLEWKAENELRRIQFTYPLGSIRQFAKTSESNRNLGSTTLYSRTLSLKYKRANDDYVPTYPTVTWGDDWIYEGDTLAGGVGGTWTLTGSGTKTQTITPDKNLDLEVTARSGDVYTSNGTSIGASNASYPRIRVRYKCINHTGTVAGEVESNLGDITGLTSLTNTNWTVVDVAMPAGTTNTLKLYNKTLTGDGLGHVIYDFVQIYVGTYILPNCVKMSPPLILNDAVIPIPGRIGSVDQSLGMQSVEVRLTCDLDMEPALLTWKRPQASSPKDDYSNIDIFRDLTMYGAVRQPWHWLDLGSDGGQFKARLVEVHPDYSGEAGMVELVFREYRHGSAADESYVARFGLG